jgi:hypothetical protein
MRNLNATHSAVIDSDDGLTASLRPTMRPRSLSGSFGADVARSTGSSPVLTATNGNWAAEPGAFGTGDETDSVTAMLNRDDNWTFAMFPPYS